MLCLLSVLNGKLTNYDVTKSSSDNFPTFPRTVPFVRRRKRAIFNVKYLGDVLMKSCKTLDYDYFDYDLFFKVKIKPGPISLHLTFNCQTRARNSRKQFSSRDRCDGCFPKRRSHKHGFSRVSLFVLTRQELSSTRTSIVVITLLKSNF